MAVMGVWKPLSGQIVLSFGQGKCTFDCRSRNFKTYGSGNHVSSSSYMLRISEKLITLNMTFILTFYTNLRNFPAGKYDISRF